MGKLWERLIAGLKRPMKGPESPPRRSPWVMVGHVPTDQRISCTFCGREQVDLAGAAADQGDFVLVHARHNPRLQHIVCGECVKWNRITSA